MLLQIPDEELNGPISGKARIKGFSLEYASSDTAKLSYAFKILGISTSVSAKVRIISIGGSRLTVEIEAGKVGDFLLDKAKDFLIKKTPEGLVESFENKLAVLNLDAVPELQSVLESITVNSISFTEESVLVDAAVK